MDMKKWLESLPGSGKPLPILSFPAVKLLETDVYNLTHSDKLQSEGIVRVAKRTDAAAAVTMMDLSVEAEAFGCKLKAPADEVPTVVGTLVSSEEEAEGLRVPEVGEARTGMYISAARQAKEQVNDRPVLAGIIGPFSLAGRLMDVTEALICCMTDPDFVRITVQKTTDFLLKYAAAYKEAGLDGIVMAEPLAGLLSPELEEEFSAPYVKKIIDTVQDTKFAVIYHNCGPNTPKMISSISGNGAAAYHFGDAVSMKDMLEKMPSDKPVCGNISPVEYFLKGTPDKMRSATLDLISECSSHKNFVLSSGCDIPPSARWENIDAFFNAAEEAHERLI